MNSANLHNGSIHVFGLGVRFIAQMTLESNYLLQQMECIFHGEDDPGVRDYIESIGVKEVSLWHLYEDGKLREQAYAEMSGAIVESARAGIKCAYLAVGNPVFLNAVVSKLRQATTQYGIPFFVYSGVSSIDTMLTDLFLPVGTTGIQCFEATHFVRLRPTIDRRVPLAIFQPAVVDAKDVRYLSGAYLPGVKKLQEFLVELYGKDQRWILLRSGMSRDDNPVVSTGTLSSLVEKARDLELGTLLIPGAWECGEYFDQPADKSS